MSVSLATKLRWFDRGAAAFAEVFPDTLARLGLNASPPYVCPECPQPDGAGQYRIQLFPRDAVPKRDLRAEHVPPESFGGRALLLTCGACNHTAGAQLEAHARRSENVNDALRGSTKKPLRVRLSVADRTVFATLKAGGGMLDFALPPWSRNANNPTEVLAFREALSKAGAQTVTFSIGFSGDPYDSKRAHVTWLRHAYLALFAIAGYRYIFSSGLGLVRKQIKEPDLEHIPAFLALLPEDRLWSERRIVYIRKPEWLESWAVQFGRFIAFLPRAGDSEFYARLARDRSLISRPCKVSGDEIEWPTEPSFGLGQYSRTP